VFLCGMETRKISDELNFLFFTCASVINMLERLVKTISDVKKNN
jgi:hypothetical protein